MKQLSAFVSILIAIFIAGDCRSQSVETTGNQSADMLQQDTLTVAGQKLIDGRSVNVDVNGIQSLSVPEEKNAIKPEETIKPE